jgi:hypothetical protein
MAITVRFRGDASHFTRTILGMEIRMNGMAGVALNLGQAIGKVGLAGGLAAAASAAVALGAGLAFIKDSSGKAAGIESLTMQFETLLGSAQKARERMEEIKKFAASTPFEVKNLSETSKLLQTLGGDMLATGSGLRMVGDAASIAAQPIQEVGLHIGRIFNAITSGTSAGESIARMQELGLMTGKVKLEFEDLAAAQKKGWEPAMKQAAALTLLQKVFSRTEGAMERLSKTTEGKLSNLTDSMDNLKVAFGTGFNDGLKVALDATNNFLPQLEGKFTKMGKLFGSAIKQAVEGDFKMFAEIGILIAEAVGRGFQDVAGNFLTEAMRDFATKQGLKQGDSPERVKAVTDNYFGPKRGIPERAMDIMDAMKPQIQDVFAAERGSEWGRKLEAQRLQVDRQLLEEAKKTNANLKNLAPQTITTSR